MADSVSLPSLTGLAVKHPLNLLLLAAAGASAALTGSWIPLAVGAGAELLWLTVGSRMGGQRDFVEFKQRAAQLAARTRGQQAKLSQLGAKDRERFLTLDGVRSDIRRLVAESDRLEQDMLEPELAKVDGLVESFLDLASRSAVYESFVDGSDLNTLEEEARRQEAIVDRTEDPDDKLLAAQNLQLMQARLQRAVEVRQLLKRSRGQLNLVANTLELLRDQIATLQSPAALSEQLDELVRSVEAIEASAKETRALEGQARASHAAISARTTG